MSILAGYLLDAVMGDPRWLPHPVRGIGCLIASGERSLNRGRPVVRVMAGAVLTLWVVAITAGVAWALVAGAGLLHPLLGDLVTAVGVGILLARKSLMAEAGTAIHQLLSAGDLPAARQALSWVVGRDTVHLDEADVARGAVETLAENLSDGVVAPLLFAMVGGLPAMAAYKAINTLDSMIGHRDDRYLYFGRFAARLDDLANWIPARVTALALIAAAGLQSLAVRAAGRRGLAVRAAWRAALADGPTHASPNAGWPEATMAGALGIRLGGVNYYDGEPHTGAFLNATGTKPGANDIHAAVRLGNLAAHLILVVGLVLRLIN